MSHKQRFGGERVWLDVDVRTRDLVNERRFPDVRVTADEERAGIWIYGRQTRYVLPDLFEIRQRILLAAHNRCHSTNGLGYLERREKVVERTGQAPPF